MTKFSPTGTVLYSTYLGGPCDDVARDVAVDAAGNAYVTGRANGGVCTADVEPGVLVTKLDTAGSVLRSFVFGGSLADTSIGQAITVDGQGDVYVAGLAQAASHDFPTTAGAFRTRDCADVWDAAGADGFVAKLNVDGGVLLYSTFLCGTGHDSPNGIAVDAAGNAYVAGSTESRDFPTAGALQGVHHGGPTAVTGFVSKLSPDGSQLVYSTYLGGSTNDAVQDVAIDAQANVYVTGETESSDFPTTAGVVQPQGGNRLCMATLCSDAFVSKIDASGAFLAYSTYLFGEGEDGASRITVDAGGDAHVVGGTSSLYFPIVRAVQPTKAGVSDAFVAELNADGAPVLVPRRQPDGYREPQRLHQLALRGRVRRHDRRGRARRGAARPREPDAVGGRTGRYAHRHVGRHPGAHGGRPAPPVPARLPRRRLRRGGLLADGRRGRRPAIADAARRARDRLVRAAAARSRSGILEPPRRDRPERADPGDGDAHDPADRAL